VKLDASSQNTSIATVSSGNGHTPTTFKVTSHGVGSTDIVVMDAMSNIVMVPVSVSAQCTK
jgi:hypothetical protein